MIEKSFAILFYLKKRTGYTTGALPIYMRITVNSVVKEIATKQECEPERWNMYAQRAKGTNEASRIINALLDTLERQVHEARRKLIEVQKPVTAKALKDVLTGKTERPRMLLEVFAEHNRQMAALANREYSPATVTRYETTLEHTGDRFHHVERCLSAVDCLFRVTFFVIY